MLTIGTFSKLSQVTTNTLRYYDEIGLLKPVHVNTENGYRYYDVAQLKTVLLINKLKYYGCSLEEIGSILEKSMEETLLSSLLYQKQRQLQKKAENDRLILEQLDQDIANLERGTHLMSYLDQIEVKLTETKPMNILFFRSKINVYDYGKHLGALFERIAKDGLTATGAPMAIFHDEQHNPDNYDMEIAVPIKEAVKGTRDLPGYLCASATLKGPYTGLPGLYAKIEQYMEAEGLAMAGSPFEIYTTDPSDNIPQDEYLTEVYFPAKKI